MHGPSGLLFHLCVEGGGRRGEGGGGRGEGGGGRGEEGGGRGQTQNHMTAWGAICMPCVLLFCVCVLCACVCVLCACEPMNGCVLTWVCAVCM